MVRTKNEVLEKIFHFVLTFVVVFLTLGIFVLPTFAILDSCPPLEPGTMIKVVKW